jgi:HAD superfamily hydrolase (TIGR01509 family)
MPAFSLPAPVGPWSLQAVVFDLDGLLLDTEPIFLQVVERFLGRRGHALTAELHQAMMGSPAKQVLTLFRSHFVLEESIEGMALECSELFFQIWEERPAALLPGALELLDRLEAAGIPRAIATSSRSAYVERVLPPFALLPRFAFVLTADDVTLGKPDPEIYAKAAARFGLPPGRTLVLEDSVNGMRAAKAAGARCIVVPHVHVDRSLLAAADAVVDSLSSPVLAKALGWRE